MGNKKNLKKIAALRILTSLLFLPFCPSAHRLGDPIHMSEQSNSSSLRPPTLSGKFPTIIGHRGSSGTHPEESLAAYEKAAEVGADYLECDVQVTKDNVLVCSHEPNLSFLITDIEEDKHRTKFPLSDFHEELIDETRLSPPNKRRGWFIADYTWDDIQSVGLVQRYIERDSKYNGQFPLITVDQLLDVAIKHGKGVYLESKESTWYQNTRNVNLPKLLIEFLCRRGFCRFVNDGPNVELNTAGPVPTSVPIPVILQTFCYDDLVYWNDIGATKIFPTTALTYIAGGLHGLGHMQHRVKANPGEAPTVKLDPRLVDPEDLKRLHVAFLGPDKNLVNPEYIKEAHANGLAVHAWTFRNEPSAMTIQNKEGDCSRDHVEHNIAPQFDSDVYKEMKFYYDIGLDGFFTDFPATLRNFLDVQELLAAQKVSQKVTQKVTEVSTTTSYTVSM